MYTPWHGNSSPIRQVRVSQRSDQAFCRWDSLRRDTWGLRCRPHPPLRGGVTNWAHEAGRWFRNGPVDGVGLWRKFRHCYASDDGCPCSNSSADHHGGADLNRRRVDDCSTDDHGGTDHHRRANDDSNTDHHRRANDDSNTDHHRRTHHQRWHNNYDWAYSVGMAR